MYRIMSKQDLLSTARGYSRTSRWHQQTILSILITHRYCDCQWSVASDGSVQGKVAWQPRGGVREVEARE
jgi:hypothetical protein